jgi:hypothetical protein
MHELGDVQAAGAQVTGDRRQVHHHVVERQQVAQRVQHRDGQVEPAVDGEVAHVGLDDGQPDRGGPRRLPRAGAHRR